jgi:hypothetical protein
MLNFCIRKSLMSRRIRSRIQKGLSPWIRGQGIIVWWKKPEVENLVTLLPLIMSWRFAHRQLQKKLFLRKYTFWVWYCK